jgi:hypothetical protein
MLTGLPVTYCHDSLYEIELPTGVVAYFSWIWLLCDEAPRFLGLLRVYAPSRVAFSWANSASVRTPFSWSVASRSRSA